MTDATPNIESIPDSDEILAKIRSLISEMIDTKRSVGEIWQTDINDMRDLVAKLETYVNDPGGF